MDFNNMSKEELELLSYTDLTNMILKEHKTPMNTPSIFKKICELLGYSDEEYASKIGDYYTSLTLDKRFVLLDTEWDLAQRHAVKIELDDDDEEEVEEEVEEDEEESVEESEEEEEDIDAVDDDEDLDDEDDIDDLAIIPEEELEEN